MSNKFFTIILIISIVALAIITSRFSCGKKKLPCPEIKTGAETTLVAVVVHDTVTNTIRGAQIRVHDTVATSRASATGAFEANGDTAEVADSTTCYSFEEHESDGANIKVDFCSDALPKNKPIDVFGNIHYQAPPDSIRRITLTDTIICKAEPFYKDWKAWAAMLVVTGLSAYFFSGHK